jgi:hypothetical protein
MGGWSKLTDSEPQTSSDPDICLIPNCKERRLINYGPTYKFRHDRTQAEILLAINRSFQSLQFRQIELINQHFCHYCSGLESFGVRSFLVSKPAMFRPTDDISPPSFNPCRWSGFCFKEGKEFYTTAIPSSAGNKEININDERFISRSPCRNGAL